LLCLQISNNCNKNIDDNNIINFEAIQFLKTVNLTTLITGFDIVNADYNKIFNIKALRKSYLPKLK
jgi:hypothetical protein